MVLYKVWWKGYSKKDSTWEPIDNLSNSMDAVRQFDQNRSLTHEDRNSLKPKASGL